MNIAWDDLWAALALMFILEGILPFLSPNTFRQMLESFAQTEAKGLRMFGLFYMALGIIVLYWVRG